MNIAVLCYLMRIAWHGFSLLIISYNAHTEGEEKIWMLN